MADVTIPSLTSFTNLNDTDMLVVEQVSSGTGKTTYANLKSKLKTALVGDADITGLGGSTVAGAIEALNGIVGNSGAAIHNSIGRGKNLGTSVSSAQWAAIKNGSFTDMYIGDYWVADSTNWRIAAFDYYYGRNSVNKHHVVIVPDKALTTITQYHSSTDISGGYVASTMHTTTLPGIKTNTIDGIFGSAHILPHTMHLSSGISNGIVSAHAATDNCYLVLMTSENVFGTSVQTSTDNDCVVSEDAVQFPLFRLFPERISIGSTTRYWLRDVCPGTSTVIVATVNGNGLVVRRAANATNNGCTRPSFCIFSD